MFAGVGGFHKGLEQANDFAAQQKRKNNELQLKRNSRNIETTKREYSKFSCVWANEWDKFPSQIYKRNFSQTQFFEGDIRLVKADDIPEADLLCAGFPCQPFSLAGKRKGFEETRGTLFYEICRIAKDKRIPYLLLENVKGLLSAQEGEAFGEIISCLDELGYVLQWKVLNSKNFGVPQNRERVFIVGCLGEKRFRQIFPLGKSNQEINKREVSEQIASPVFAKQYKIARGMNMIELTQNQSQERKRVDGKAVLTSMHERRIRRLTPIECERLQGFPDNWTAGLSDTQRYKCMGNAVTVNVIEAIGRKIMQVIEMRRCK